MKDLAAFFGKFPAGQWVSWENMRTYHVLREDLPSLFDGQRGGLQALALRTSDASSTSLSVHGKNALELVSEPLLKGYGFLLAGFGLVEIAYDAPTHPAYHRPNLAYLPPLTGSFLRA